MMRPLLTLSVRTAGTSRSTLVLPVVAFTLTTALLLALVGGAQTFWRMSDEEAFFYQAMAMVALTLLCVPLGALGGAAARLSARRRDDRLATLRLLGVTAAAVRLVTVIESATLAFIGAVVGSVLSFAILPLIGLIPFRGEAPGFVGVIPPVGAFLAVIAGITLLAAVSSVLSLQAVSISPLGVRTRQNAPKMSWLRPVIGVAVIGLALAIVSVGTSMATGPIVLIALLLAAFGGTLAVLNLIGPWFLSKMAKGQARRARTAERLLAARRVTDDPKGAWRQVSGVAMASFTAVITGAGVAILSLADGNGQDTLLSDIRTGVIITVIGSFILVACAVGVSQAADILDRRELAVSLRMLGASPATMESARRRAVMSPLIITSVGSVISAIALALPIVGLALVFSPVTMAVVIGVLAFGCALVWVGLQATASLQRSVATLA